MDETTVNAETHKTQFSNEDERPKDVIAARGRMIGTDKRQCVQEERAQVVDAAADALARAAAGSAVAAVGVVLGDGRAHECQRGRGVIERAAAEAVAAIAAAGALAASGQ